MVAVGLPRPISGRGLTQLRDGSMRYVRVAVSPFTAKRWQYDNSGGSGARELIGGAIPVGTRESKAMVRRGLLVPCTCGARCDDLYLADGVTDDAITLYRRHLGTVK